MSFIEFLLEYYIYILAVLIIIIVGVIGFLVDSKNKEKKKMETNVNDNTSGSAVNNLNRVDNEISQLNGAVESISNISNVTVDQSSVMSTNNTVDGTDISFQLQDTSDVNVIPQLQVVDEVSNVPLNGVSAVNLGASSMSNVFNNDVNATNNLNVHPVSVNEVNTRTNEVLNANSNSNVLNMGINLQSGMNDNLGTNVPYNKMMNNQTQSSMLNRSVNSVPVQSMQSQVNVGIDGIPVETINASSINGSTLNPTNNSVNQSNVNPLVSNNNVDPLSFKPLPSTTSNVNQGQMMNITNGMSNSGQIQNGNYQRSGQSDVSVGMPQNVNLPNNNIQGTNVVFTSDSAQPFDVSSMFANNNNN